MRQESVTKGVVRKIKDSVAWQLGSAYYQDHWVYRSGNAGTTTTTTYKLPFITSEHLSFPVPCLRPLCPGASLIEFRAPSLTRPTTVAATPIYPCRILNCQVTVLIDSELLRQPGLYSLNYRRVHDEMVQYRPKTIKQTFDSLTEKRQPKILRNRVNEANPLCIDFNRKSVKTRLYLLYTQAYCLTLLQLLRGKLNIATRGFQISKIHNYNNIVMRFLS